jgi:hypothetical protein
MINDNLMMNSTAGNYLPTTKEAVQFLILFLSMIVVFYVNNVLAFKYLAMFILALLAFISNKKFIWIAIFWVIVDSVGGLFSEKVIGEAVAGIPIINISSGISVGIKDLLLLAMLFSLTPMNRFSRINYDHLLFYGLILFAALIGSLFFEASYKIVVSVVLRGYIIFLLYYTIRAEFKLQNLIQLFHLISLLLPVILIDQIFQAAFGIRLLTRYTDMQFKTVVNTFTGDVRAVSFGMNTIFFSFVYGLFLLTIKRAKDMKIASFFYGAMLVVMSVTSVMLSATRGILGVFGVILLFVSPYLVLKIRNVAIVLGVIFFLMNILGVVGLNVDYFYRNTVVRVLATVLPVLTGGGLNEMDTSGRTTELPDLLDGIRHSPIVGYGISNNLFGVYNSNFGGLNTAVQFGIPAAIMILIIVFSWMFKLNRINKRLPQFSIYQSMGRVVYATLIGMMVGYLTTYNYFTSFFAYDILRLIFIMIMSSMVFGFYRQYSAQQLFELQQNAKKK